MGEAVFSQFPVKTKVLMVKPNWECTKPCIIILTIISKKITGCTQMMNKTSDQVKTSS